MNGARGGVRGGLMAAVMVVAGDLAHQLRRQMRHDPLTDVLNRRAAAGDRFVYVTNNSRSHREEYRARLMRHGVPLAGDAHNTRNELLSHPAFDATDVFYR